MKYNKNIYIGFDPFEDERDTGITYKRVKVVKTRILHECCGMDHVITLGSTAQHEVVFMDNKPYSSYMCTDCIDNILMEIDNGTSKETWNI